MVGTLIRLVNIFGAVEIAALHLIPGAGLFLAAPKTVEALKPVEDAHRLLVELNLVAVDPHNPRRVADVLPTALNLIWAIGVFVVSGQTLVDQLQRELTLQQRPDQSRLCARALAASNPDYLRSQ